MGFISKIITFFLSVHLTVAGWFGLTPQQTLRVNMGEKYQIHEGFGTSSAWWAQNISDEALAQKIAALLYNTETGLGLDIFRYNVGAGSKENPESVIVVEDRKTESFLIKDEESGAFVYDFSRDANARRMMDLAVQNGATKIVLFCNSPHWSMTENGLASGSMQEGHCNLPRENYRSFVEYLLTIADHFVAEGYPVYGISPINEPQWNWGTGWISQEGCHYSPEETVAVLECFALEMQKRNVSYKLLGPESGQMDDRYIAYEEAFFNSDILRNYCDTYSGHTYWLDGNAEQKQATGNRFRSIYKGLKYETSEWCELPLSIDSATMESGMLMADVIYEDLTMLDAVSWQSWTAVNGDGLMDLSDTSLQIYKRYPVFRQFSFIPLGAQRIGVIDSLFDRSTFRTVCYVSGADTVFVIINHSADDQTVRIKGLYKSCEVYVTSEDKNCQQVCSGRFSGKFTLEAESVTTIVLHGHGAK